MAHASARAHDPRLRTALLGLVFFASGASGLVYEVAWTRAIRLVVGSTTLSHTIVLAAFMGGLALGAWLAGRRIDRAARPLRVYGVLELAIGVYGLLLPFLVHAIEPAVGALYRACEGRPALFALGELLLLGPVVLPGSALMGATLPALGRALTDVKAKSLEAGVARQGGFLYALNTVGAALGAALSGFVVLPALGLMGTTLVAALTNGGLAAAVFAIDGRARREESAAREAPSPEPVADEATDARALATGILAVALTGLAGMTLQIAWTKLFVTTVGSSTFAFTGVVSVYILGIGLGAALGTRALGLRASPGRLFAGAALASAVGAALTAPFFGWLPTHTAEITSALFDELKAGHLAPVLSREMFWLLLALAPATVCLGATFPLGVALAGGSPARPGRALARISAASSLGSIAGALVGGLGLLPLLGLTGALRAAALVMTAAGLVALEAARGTGSRRWSAGLAASLALVVLLVPGPDARLLDAGAFLFKPAERLVEARQKAGPDAKVDASQVVRRPDRLVKHGEGEDLVAATYSTGYDEYLVINGKVDASSRADAETQLLVAHITMLLHGPGAKRVCVIGLGSGMTTGAILAHPGVEHVDLVEISRTVVEIVRASKLFGFLSHGALDDPRTRLLVADGRTHLWNTDAKYDVIVSEPTNPWIAGVGDLYTTEYFERLKARLAPGGLVGQWLQGYSTTPELWKTIVRTFRGVFPDVQIWRFAQGEDFLLVARKEGGDLSLRLEDVKARAAANPALQESLAESNVFAPSGLEWYFALDPASVRTITGDEGPRNTDDSGYLEFRAPLALFLDAFPLDEPKAVELARHAPAPFVDADPDELERVRSLREDYYAACRLRRYDPPGGLAKADALLARIIEQAPPPATFVRSERAEVLAERLLRGEIADEAGIRAALDAIATVPSRSPRVLASYAAASWKIGESDRAEAAYRRVLELRPFWDEGRTRLATLLVARRAWPDALEVLRGVAEPTADSLTLEGSALAGTGKPDEARERLDRAVALDPRSLKAWIVLGQLRARAGDLAGARDAFARATECEPRAAGAWFDLAFACYRLHDLTRARASCAKALELDPRDERARSLDAELRKSGS